MLREPVDRIVSLYKYRRYKEGVDVPVSMSFDEFLDSKRWSREGHLYVDTFCGSDDLEPRSDEAVEAAIANLGRLAVVGRIECPEEFSRRVTELLGAEVSIPVLNQSPAPESAADDEIGAAALERARRVCAPDTRVYEAARALSPSL
jgi:hypothetical protein